MRISGIRPHLVLEHLIWSQKRFGAWERENLGFFCVKIKIVVELPCLLKFLQGCSRKRLGQGFPSDSRYVNKP